MRYNAIGSALLAATIGCASTKSEQEMVTLETKMQAERAAAQTVTCADTTPLQHVYHPHFRFHLLSPCAEITGMVKKVYRELDGDTHLLLKPDSGYEWMINKINKRKQEHCMVVEIVCAYKPFEKDPKAACKDYKNSIRIPKVGEHIRVIGAYVSDVHHEGWDEIHPVYSIEKR